MTEDTREAVAQLRAIRDESDMSRVCWAASALTSHVATAAIGVPDEAADIVAARLQRLDWGLGPQTASAREAASSLVTVLLQLARLRPQDADMLRERLLEEPLADRSWLKQLIAVLPHDEDSTRGAGSAVFVSTCLLLALLGEGQPELAKMLRDTGIVTYIATELLLATAGGTGMPASRVSGPVWWRTASSTGEARRGPAHHLLADGGPYNAPGVDNTGTEWLPFATAAAHALEVLLLEEDPDRLSIAEPSLFQPVWTQGHRPEVIVDALLASLHRDLNSGGNLVAQALHRSSLRTLAHVARLSAAQARRIASGDGVALAAKVLELHCADKEAIVIALACIAELSAHRHELKPLGLSHMAQQALERYPRHDDVRVEALRVLASCKR